MSLCIVLWSHLRFFSLWYIPRSSTTELKLVNIKTFDTFFSNLGKHNFKKIIEHTTFGYIISIFWEFTLYLYIFRWHEIHHIGSFKYTNMWILFFITLNSFVPSQILPFLAGVLGSQYWRVSFVGPGWEGVAYFRMYKVGSNYGASLDKVLGGQMARLRVIFLRRYRASLRGLT